MDRAVGAHRLVDSREEGLFAEAREKPETLELILHRILHFGETQLDARGVQGVVEFAEASAAVTSTLVTGSAVTTSQRTGVGEFATASRTRSSNSSALAKNSGASQRNSTRPGIRRASRIAGDVVIALDAFDAAQHGRMRPPAIPEKLDYGDHDRETDARNGAEHGDADEARHRKPELPALDAIDAAEVGTSIRPMAEAMTTAARAVCGRC